MTDSDTSISTPEPTAAASAAPVVQHRGAPAGVRQAQHQQKENASRRNGPGRIGHQRQSGAARQAARPIKHLHPLLEKLASLYPALFGQRLLPLKRGILQDLLAAHPTDLTKDELKVALGLHTRSTRYLTAMASGQQRHDLTGTAVEAVAPEHQHHALVEVFKRRQQRSEQDLKPELRQRMLQGAEASGLAPLEYAQRVRTGNEEANALLDDAMGELAAWLAKDQALLQAFEASGETVTAFADAHGLHPIEAAAILNRARARRAVTSANAAVATSAAEAPAT